MKSKNPITLYFRSNLNISLLVITVLLSVFAVYVLADFLKIIVPLSIVFFYLAISVYFISSKRGVKEIIKENEEDRLHELEETITEYNDIRDTVSYLRINDKDIRKSIEYFKISRWRS